MTNADLVDALELSSEALEVVADNITGVHLAIVGVLGAAAGAAAGYFACKRFFVTKYEKQIEQEIEETRTYYKRLSVEFEVKFDIDKEPPDPVDSIVVSEASDSMTKYQWALRGGQVGPPPEPKEEGAVNVYTTPRDDSEFNYEEELEKRTSDNPYIISLDEFSNNENDWTQTTLTYYAGDNTLADDRDQEIPYADPIVGEDNLEQFGHGSGNPHVVYIRNERLSIEFEVLRTDTKFAHEVLGLEHADGGHRGRKFEGRPRKFRNDDD